MTAVAVSLGKADPIECDNLDADGDGFVEIGELISAVHAALYGCLTSTASRGATELVESIATDACRTSFTPGGIFEIASVPGGARMHCDSFTLHNGTFSLVKFPSIAAARATFDRSLLEEYPTELAGGVLRELRSTPSGFPGATRTGWSWWSQCWIASGSTFDDTGYILTPVADHVVPAIAESELWPQLIDLCF